jgi:integrating conjugative element protein (TIGR03759 family)
VTSARYLIFGTVISAAVVWAPTQQAHAVSDSPAIVSSRTVPDRTQSTTELALDTRLARDWGLKAEEWARYRRLMAGPLGILSPHLDPLTALGIEARSQAEREHYAELEVRMEGERVAKLLAYQRAYDAAWKRLYPNLEPVEFAPTAPGRPQIADANVSKRLAVFVKEPCAACDATVKTLEARGRSFDIYMVGLEDDAQLRAWAARVGLNAGEVRSGTITLNHDDGRWLAIGDASPLPAVLAQVGGRWQRE